MRLPLRLFTFPLLWASLSRHLSLFPSRSLAWRLGKLGSAGFTFRYQSQNREREREMKREAEVHGNKTLHLCANPLSLSCRHLVCAPSPLLLHRSHRASVSRLSESQSLRERGSKLGRERSTFRFAGKKNLLSTSLAHSLRFAHPVSLYFLPTERVLSPSLESLWNAGTRQSSCSQAVHSSHLGCACTISRFRCRLHQALACTSLTRAPMTASRHAILLVHVHVCAKAGKYAESPE